MARDRRDRRERRAQALSGELDDARRLLGAAFARRHDLADLARDDPDLAALGGELSSPA